MRRDHSEPSTLETVDRVVCQHFPDEFTYSETNYAAWYEVIGFMLAMGATFDEMLSPECKHSFGNGTRMHRVAAYLNEHYVANAWAQRF
jgi:hypothetical protein